MCWLYVNKTPAVAYDPNSSDYYFCCCWLYLMWFRSTTTLCNIPFPYLFQNIGHFYMMMLWRCRLVSNNLSVSHHISPVASVRPLSQSQLSVSYQHQPIILFAIDSTHHSDIVHPLYSKWIISRFLLLYTYLWKGVAFLCLYII